MNLLDEVINNVSRISTDGDIDKAVEYSEMLNEPLLTYGQYKQLKNYLDIQHGGNNHLMNLDIRTRNIRTYQVQEDYRLITHQLSNVQEEYMDDFI